MTNRCPLCEDILGREVKIVRSEYRGIPYYYEQIGDWCYHCKESFLSKEDLESSREEREYFKKLIDLDIKYNGGNN